MSHWINLPLVGCIFYATAFAAPDLVPTRLQILGERTPCAGPLPGSAHAYANFLDVSWTNTCPDADFLEVAFDSRTSLEEMFDYLFVMDAGGTNVPGSPFTGSELAGRTLLIPGNTVVLRLETDGAITDWGFAVSSLSALGPSPMPLAVAGQDIHIVWGVENQGTDAVTGYFVDSLFVSPDSFWTNGAWLGYESGVETLEPGAGYARYRTVSLPSYLSGDQFLIVHLDGEQQVAESDEGNNELMQALRIATPDLAVVALTAPTNMAPQQPITVSWIVTNLSAYNASDGWHDRFSVINETGTNFLSSFWHEGPLLGGASYTVTQDVRLYGVKAGTNLLQIEANTSGLAETFRTNNFATAPIFVTPPDLVALRAEVPALVTARQPFSATLVVSNGGPVTAYPEWYDFVYVSPTNRWTAEAVRVGQAFNYYSSIDPGVVYTQYFSMTIGAPCSGDCHLLLVADGWTNLADSVFNNNIVAVPLRIESADLVPISFNASHLTAAPNESINLDWRVENRGTATAFWPWIDAIELATEPTGSNSFLIVGSSWAEQNLAPGANYFRSVTGQVPPVPPGEYYLVLKTDRYGHLAEGNETNNTLSVPITITGADLVAESISASQSVGVQEPFTVTWTVRNRGPSTAYPYWQDTLRVASTTNDLEFLFDLGAFPVTNALAAGSAYTVTQTVDGVWLPAGDYSLVLSTDYDFYPFGNTNANNRTSTPIRLVGIDLATIDLTASPVTSLGSSLSVSLLVSNAGPLTAYGPWYHYFYVSPTNQVVPDASQIGYIEVNTQLVASATTLITADLQIDQYGIQAGNRYLVGGIDTNFFSDPNPSNNEVWVPLKVQAPDLLPESFSGLLPFTNCVPPFPESPHPVRVINRMWTNTCPGADSLQITFDPRTDTSQGLIHITDGSGNPIYGSPFYGWSIAGLTFFVPGDTVRIRFTRTEDWEIWGFAVTQLVGCRAVTEFPAAPQQPIGLRWRIRNAGEGLTSTDWSDTVLLKLNRYSPYGQEITRAGRVDLLGPGESYSQFASLRLPSLKPGRRGLLLRADGDSQVAESTETNNTRSLTLEITSPDLIALDLQAPSVLEGQSTFEVVWRVANRGPVVVFPDWYDRVYVSPTNRLTPEALGLHAATRYVQLIPGEQYAATQTVTLPPLPGGGYYLVVKADDGNALFDPILENNEFAIPITIRTPDLTPVYFSAVTNNAACPGPFPSLAAPFPLNAEFRWTNSCPGAGALNVEFSAPYFSEDQLAVLDAAGHEVPASGYYGSRVASVPGSTVIFRLRTDNQSVNDFNFAVNSIVRFVPDKLPTVTPQQRIDILYLVQNFGPGAAWSSWSDKIYFSRDATLDPQDLSMAEFGRGNPLGFGPWLPSMGRYVGSGQVIIPGRPAGDYFLIFKADHYDYLRETSEGNNTAAMPIRLQTADLQVTAFSATNRAAPRENLQVSWSVRNDGLATAWPYWYDYVYLSTKPVWDETATYLNSFYRSVMLQSNQTYSVSAQVNLPRVPGGAYYLILSVDAQRLLGDSNVANNFALIPITILEPDLVPLNLTALRTLGSCPGPFPQSPPQTLPANTILRWTNTCPGAASLQLTFDPNSYVQQSLSILDRNRNPISGSPFSGWIGDRTFRVLGDRVILEFAAGPFPSYSEWRVTDISSVIDTTNAVAAPQSRLQLTWTVQNIGSGAALPMFADSLSLSADLVSDPWDTFLNTYYIAQPVGPGAQYTQQTYATLGSIPAGQYYLRLHADTYFDLPEPNETNNNFFIPITITPPADLAPVALRLPSAITSSHPRPTIEVSWTATNQGVAGTPEFWYDTIYLSRDPILDSFEEIAVVEHRGALAPAQSYAATQTVTLYTPVPGRYYVFLGIDGRSYVYEASETNNQLIATIDVDMVLPDLVVTGVTAPPRVVSSREFASVELEWVVRNQGAGAVEGSWADFVYFNSQQQMSFYRYDPLPAGGSYTNRGSVYIFVPTNGLYALTLWSDDPLQYNNILEVDETNNSKTVWFEFVRSPSELLLVAEDGSVPLWFASTSAVSLLTFDLIAPSERLYGLYATALVPELWNTQLSSVDENLWFGRMETYAGEYLSGTQEIARILLNTWWDQSSAFAPLVISNVVAQTDDGLPIPNVTVRAGRAVIIGAEPLLEATLIPDGQHSLTLYGHPGSNVVLEAQSSLTDPAWETVWQGPLTNRFQSLGPLPAADRSRFYRARY